MFLFFSFFLSPVCTWHCEHALFYVEFYALQINFYLFIDPYEYCCTCMILLIKPDLPLFAGFDASDSDSGHQVVKDVTVDTVRRFSGLEKPVIIGLEPHTDEKHADLDKFMVNLATRAKDGLVIITTSDDLMRKLQIQWLTTTTIIINKTSDLMKHPHIQWKKVVVVVVFFIVLSHWIGISPMGNLGCFPGGKPAATVTLPNLFMNAGCFSILIVHQTLTWTTGSLMRTQLLLHVIVHGIVWTLYKSLHWRLTLGEKPDAAPGNRTCVIGVPLRHSTSQAASQSHCHHHWQSNDLMRHIIQCPDETVNPLTWGDSCWSSDKVNGYHQHQQYQQHHRVWWPDEKASPVTWTIIIITIIQIQWQWSPSSSSPNTGKLQLQLRCRYFCHHHTQRAYKSWEGCRSSNADHHHWMNKS